MDETPLVLICFNLISQCLLEGISTNPFEKKNIQGLASYQCPSVLLFFNVF